MKVKVKGAYVLKYCVLYLTLVPLYSMETPFAARKTNATRAEIKTKEKSALFSFGKTICYVADI